VRIDVGLHDRSVYHGLQWFHGALTFRMTRREAVGVDAAVRFR
jgi:hypothetical protein